jgi:hypothetical protein
MASVLLSAIIESVTPATSTTKAAAMEMLKAGNSGNVENSGYLCDMDGPEKSPVAETAIAKSIVKSIAKSIVKSIAKSIVKSIAKSIATINVAAIT